MVNFPSGSEKLNLPVSYPQRMNKLSCGKESGGSPGLTGEGAFISCVLFVYLYVESSREEREKEWVYQCEERANLWARRTRPGVVGRQAGDFKGCRLACSLVSSRPLLVLSHSAPLESSVASSPAEPIQPCRRASAACRVRLTSPYLPTDDEAFESRPLNLVVVNYYSIKNNAIQNGCSQYTRNSIYCLNISHKALWIDSFPFSITTNIQDFIFLVIEIW